MGATDPAQVHELFEKFFNSRDIEGMLSLYEDDAVLLSAPGAPMIGKDAIRTSIEGMFAMEGTITFTAETDPLVNGDIALTHGKWQLAVGGNVLMEASTAEVVRRGADGQWRYIVDNPWGTALLGP